MTVSFSGIGRGTTGLDLRTILNLLSARRIVSPALIAVEIGASQDDWNPAGLDNALVISVTQDGGPFSITGLAGGGAKVSHVIVNDDTSENLTLVHESADSEAANRFNNGGSNLVLAPGEAVALDYDTASSRYVVVTTAVPFPLANAPGEQGAPGLDGTDPGYPFVFKSAVTESDPDLGNVQFNNATFASVTKIIISDFSAATDNPDVSAFIASLDDVGSDDRGRILIKARDHQERTAYLKITGAITDHGGDWAEIPVAPIGTSALNADDAVSFQYYQPGPEGEITGGVTTFNGRGGTVVPTAGDYDASLIGYDNADSGLAADTVQDAIDEVENRVDSLEDEIDTVTADQIHAATAKTAPADSDEFGITDSAASFVIKKFTWANLKAAVWTALGALIAGGTGKTTPDDADTLALSDSEATNATKKLTWANVKATLKTYFDTLYQAVDTLLSSKMERRRNSVTSSFSFALTDGAGFVRVTGGSAQTATIPANSSVAFPIGTILCLRNVSGNNWTIAITTDTLTWIPSGSTGSRTLASGGLAFMLKEDTTSWVVYGVGIS